VWDENTAKYAQQLSGLADAFKPKTEPQDPGIIREYDIARQQNKIPANMTYLEYVAARNPGAQTPVIRPYNAQLVGGGGQGGAPQPLTDEQMRQMMNGGQTAPAPSGGF
jgi:hypothetical protein